jgi:UrcA family protein
MSAKSVFLIFLMVEALGLAAAAAQAAPTASAPSVTVPLSDLDLTADAGGRIALGRIRRAADAICGGAPQPADLAPARAYRDCMSDAVDHAVAATGSPVLAALNANPGLPSATQTASRPSHATPG